MSANILPLLNLHKPITPFRLAAPETMRLGCFFKQPTASKKNVAGYSSFASERVRGRTVIPKESICFFRNSTELENLENLPPDFYRSVKALYEEWIPVRLHLLETVSQVLDSRTPLAGTTHLEFATIGVHYYNSRNLSDFTSHFSPSHIHMDSGTVTILFRSYNANDGLEIADLQTTRRHDSEGIVSGASFIPVPTGRNETPEVIVFAGTRL
ncbi:hypothetical protein BDV59DRAFT_193057 [Aspergillus ambiguus]|uniref:uncharacterized protein n=1 Tax=Aspergillus ambiguus TaxID=176160 RepID=UPI003CCD7F2B